MSEAYTKYKDMSDYYLSNAQKLMDQTKLRKASEFLWGAITQRLKSFADLQGLSIKSHNDFRKFTRNVTEETRDQEFYDLFLSLENLHRNFYDEIIDSQDFPLYYKKVLLFLQRIEDFISKIKIKSNL